MSSKRSLPFQTKYKLRHNPHILMAFMWEAAKSRSVCFGNYISNSLISKPVTFTARDRGNTAVCAVYRVTVRTSKLSLTNLNAWFSTSSFLESGWNLWDLRKMTHVLVIIFLTSCGIRDEMPSTKRWATSLTFWYRI
jgi:hypothetical protein